METETQYKYDTPAFRHHFPVKTFVINSDAWEYGTLTKYPPEYNTTTVTDVASVALKNLVDNYIIGTPVEVLKTLRKNNIDYITGGQLIKYKNLGGNRTFPNLLYQLVTTTPISGFVNSNITGGNFVSDCFTLPMPSCAPLASTTAARTY